MQAMAKKFIKKISSLFTVFLMVFFFSCGQSETEKKAEEEKTKHEADSIKANTKAVVASGLDSLNSQNKNADSLVKEEKTNNK